MSSDKHQQDKPETAHASQTTARIHPWEQGDVVVIYDDHDIGFILARTLEKMGLPSGERLVPERYTEPAEGTRFPARRGRSEDGRR